eukprot:TRINITY_DN1968_c0_g1_i1.p1 TRINITY_DN1968_c0_g1~~TRINITY_DN1968_c0_g1_i1.p1  ORF type:complete len:202 (+),score=68.19 TRINITY_DN1968_c0_g1_i1:276-881(+)
MTDVFGAPQTDTGNQEQEIDWDTYDPDEDDELDNYRERRINELKSKREQEREQEELGHGKYEEIEEGEFLPTVTGSKFCVVHFSHKEFQRCQIMDKRLRELVPQHKETKFVKIDPEKAPFFVVKLQIKTLPAVICFIDGKAVDRIVGFEELGGKDTFPAEYLARRLAKAGVIQYRHRTNLDVKKKGGIRKGQEFNDSDSES